MTVTATPPTETLQLHRPEGITDGRWAAIQTQAHKIVTGHAPWCTDHEGDIAEGWCRHELRAFCAEVTISSGTVTGATSICLYLDQSVQEDELTVAQARAIGELLVSAASIVRSANIIGDPS